MQTLLHSMQIELAKYLVRSNYVMYVVCLRTSSMHASFIHRDQLIVVSLVHSYARALSSWEILTQII